MTGAKRTSQLQVGAVIVAAGLGQRMEGVDKVFTPLLGAPLIAWTVGAFENCPQVHRIVLVVREESLDRAGRLAEERGWSKVVRVCAGGQRRQDSVARGLEFLSSCRLVAVHDGARPLVSADVIQRGIEAARKHGAAVAAVPVTDTIKVVSKDLVVDTPERDGLWAVQTPQVFRFDILDGARRRVEADVTDDSSLVERSGYEVRVFMGSYENIKVTTPRDLTMAEAILRERGN